MCIRDSTIGVWHHYKSNSLSYFQNVVVTEGAKETISTFDGKEEYPQKNKRILGPANDNGLDSIKFSRELYFKYKELCVDAY